jgi:putative protein-disulfide isomerase
MQQANRIEQTTQQQSADRISIVYYTDPLCCWSWAFEPQWRRLRYEYAGNIDWQYRLGGLLPDWRHFHDPFFSVSRPQQMGPVWMEARLQSGQPMNDRIWVDDPPSSSYPACIAVKCAQAQSDAAGEKYLRRLREALMLDGKNIARQDILFQLAEELSKEEPDFHLPSFEEAYQNGTGRAAFQQDLEASRFQGISRFPCLTLQYPGKEGLMIVGYRPYPVLLDALRQLNPKLKAGKQLRNAAEYTRFWGRCTEREIEEALARQAV